MAKNKKKKTVAAADEFALLVGQLVQEGYHGIPKPMSSQGLEVLAFDLEEREKLAKARAWIKTQATAASRATAAGRATVAGRATAGKTSKAKAKRTSNEDKDAAKKADGSELTPAQQKMAERIHKQQSKEAVPTAGTASIKKKATRRRKPKRKKKTKEDA